MKKYFPIILTVIGALSPIVSPTVQHFWSSHPDVVAALAGVWAIVKYYLPSPAQQPK